MDVRVIRWSTCTIITLAILGLSFIFWPGKGESHPVGQSTAKAGTSGFGPAVGMPTSGRIVGEFEHQDAIMLGVNELLQFHPQTLCEIVAAIGPGTKIVALISDPAQEPQARELFRNNGLAAAPVHYFYWPAQSMWVRDFGPNTLVGDDPRLLDCSYHFPDRDVEDQVPIAFAATYGMKIAPTQLTVEGGNLLSNGRGLAISSSSIIGQNEARKYDLARIGSILQHEFRFNQWSYLHPLVGEPTGHVDMFLTLTSPTTIVVGAYDPADDSQNAAVLDASVNTLSTVRVDGEPLRIVRMPMPSRRDGFWRTYTNVLFANGTLLVPQYPDYCPDLDRRALEIYRELLPTWKIVGINSSSLITKRGSLHCVSRNLPHMPALP